MKNIRMERNDKRSLQKRYLFWLYKTTKDELDKIDRKFTQLEIDRRIQEILVKSSRKAGRALQGGIGLLVEEWKGYIAQKERDALRLKFSEGGALDPKYVFLHLKLKSISQVILAMFGAGVLEEFKSRYEEAAMRMIEQDTSGRR